MYKSIWNSKEKKCSNELAIYYNYFQKKKKLNDYYTIIIE